MSDELEPVSKTHLDKVAVAPALVEAVQKNPDLLREITLGQLMIVQDRMVRKVLTDPEASAAALALVHERLSKNAKVEAPVQTGGQQVIINLIRGKGKEAVTIEGQTTKELPSE